MNKRLEEIREIVGNISRKYQDGNSGDKTVIEILAVVAAFYELDKIQAKQMAEGVKIVEEWKKDLLITYANTDDRSVFVREVLIRIEAWLKEVKDAGS